MPARRVGIFRDSGWVFWLGVVVAVMAAMVNIAKLVINLWYLQRYPAAVLAGVDPLSGFLFGLIVIGIVCYLLRGLRQRGIWAAVGLVVAMPLLYVAMADGLAAAIVHEQMYFPTHPEASLWLEVLPAAALVVVFGFAALDTYGRRVRRVR